MSGSVILSSGAGATRKYAERLVVEFEGGYTGASWYAETVDIIPGAAWSRAIINIMHDSGARREAAGTIPLNLDGPLGRIMVGKAVQVRKAWVTPEGLRRGQVVFNGIVQHPESNLDLQGLQITAYDMRFDLREVRVVGRWIYNVSADETNFQMGWGAGFNPGGRPNCIFNPSQEPLFAPYPDYGLEDDEAPPDPSEEHNSKACYWTLKNMLKYLRKRHGPDADAVGQWPAIPAADGRLIWPENLGVELDEELVANFDNAVGQNNNSLGGSRKGRDLAADGVSLLDLLSDIFWTAGGWTLGIEYKDDFQSVLKVWPTTYGGKGITIPFKAGGAPGGEAIVTGGTFFEDGEDLATCVMGAGALVFIESLLSSASNKILWSHSSDRFHLWKKLIYELGNDPDAFAEACRRVPEAACTVKLEPNNNFMTGTLFENFPRAKLSRPVWPRQLSMMTTGAGANDFAGMTYPIYTEINTGSWIAGPVFDGLEIFDTGIIHMPIVRELEADVRSWRWTTGTEWTHTTENGVEVADITMRDIRMNLAIPCDHRVSFAAFLPSDPFPVNDGSMEAIADSPDVSRIAPAYARRKYIDLRDLYDLWLRIGSYPMLQSVDSSNASGAAPAPDKTGLSGADPSYSNAVRSDWEYLKAYVKKRLKDEGRLVKGGELRIGGWLCTSYAPGQSVKALKPVGGGSGEFPARCVILGYRLESSGGKDGSVPENNTYLKVGTHSLVEGR